MRWNVIPISSSPLRIAHATGVGPRWRGSSDGWPLTQPSRGTARASAGIFHGKPMQTTRSGSTERSSGAIERAPRRDEDVELGRELREIHPHRRVVTALAIDGRQQRDELVPESGDRRAEALRHRQDLRDDDDAPAAHWSRRILAPDAWFRALTTISSTFTCHGRVSAKRMQSTTSSACSGSTPR